MLHTLEKGEYPKGHRYWSNATGDLNAALEDLPVQLRRVLDELWSDGYGVECYLVEWNGRYCVQLSAMYDGSYAADLGIGYPELVELARRRAEELGAERPDLHVVFAEDVDQWKANDPFTEIWVVMPWDVDADAFHEVAGLVRFPLPFQRVAGYGNIRGHLGGAPSPCGTGREGNTYARCEDGENLGEGERGGHRGP